ncbi:hypothetical protein [Lonepinella sp. BR2271]|uniref:hypothetical protein n=1 Tax=Lonepinella sp. BR2271 TaxID=3434550 RepID=UPI003F6E1AC5
MKINKLYGLCLITLFPALASAVENPVVLPSDIIGEWTCQIFYPRLGVESLDQFDFQADGTSLGIGIINFQKTFTYESHHTGHWELKGNMLSETSTNYVFGKIHSKETEQKLKNSPELNEFEQKIFQTFTQNANDGKSVNIEITELKGNKMRINHVWDNQERHAGLCVKKTKENS